MIFPNLIFHVHFWCDDLFLPLFSSALLSFPTIGIGARFVMMDEEKIRIERSRPFY